jgi:hypothetical protein
VRGECRRRRKFASRSMLRAKRREEKNWVTHNCVGAFDSFRAHHSGGISHRRLTDCCVFTIFCPAAMRTFAEWNLFWVDRLLRVSRLEFVEPFDETALCQHPREASGVRPATAHSTSSHSQNVHSRIEVELRSSSHTVAQKCVSHYIFFSLAVFASLTNFNF